MQQYSGLLEQLRYLVFQLRHFFSHYLIFIKKYKNYKYVHTYVYVYTYDYTYAQEKIQLVKY